MRFHSAIDLVLRICVPSREHCGWVIIVINCSRPGGKICSEPKYYGSRLARQLQRRGFKGER